MVVQKNLRERCRVLEKADLQGYVWRVVLIEEGVSLNGAYYSKDALERAAPKYEGVIARIYEFKAGERPYYDHCPEDVWWYFPEGVTKNAAGWFQDVQFEEIESLKTPGKMVWALTADFHVTDEWTRSTLNNAWDVHGRRDFLGFSHDSYCDWELGVVDGAYVDVILDILDVYEVTLVTTPAAGGGFLRKVASIGGQDMYRLGKRLVASLKDAGKNPDEVGRGLPMTADRWKQITEGLGGRPTDQQLESIATATGVPVAELRTLADQDEADRQKQLRESRRPMIQALRQLGYRESVEDRSDEELPGILATALRAGSASFSEGLRAEVQRVEGLLGANRVGEAIQLLQDALLQHPVQGRAPAGVPGAPLAPSPGPAPAPAPQNGAAPLPKEVAEALAEIRQGQEELRRGQESIRQSTLATRAAESRRLLSVKLKESELPEPTQRLIESQCANRTLTESEITGVIEDNRRMLAALQESGVRGMGGQQRVEVGPDTVDKRCRRLDLMMGVTPSDADKRHYEGLRPYRGLREAYVDFTGDPEVTKFYSEGHLRLLESRPRITAMRAYEAGRYLEASTADFQYALGVSMTLRLAQAYTYIKSPWRTLCRITDIENFKQQEIVRWGSMGELPDVAEKGTYQEIVAADDERATYTPSKKGAKFSLTWEMILNDDIRILRDVPQRFARIADRRISRDFFDLLLNYGAGAINGGTIYDGLALYHDAHFNVVERDLDHEALVLARTAMRKQFEYGPRSALAANLTDSAGTMTVTTGEGVRFSAGVVAVLGSEKVLVTGAPTGDSVPISRAYDGTTAAAHSNLDGIIIVGDYLEFEPKYLVVPSELESRAIILRDSAQLPGSANNDVNQFKGKFEIVPVNTMRLRGNARNWFALADPMEAPLIEVGFVQGKREPEMFIQDQQTVMSGRAFDNDETTYKLRQAWGMATCDPKAAVGGLPS